MANKNTEVAEMEATKEKSLRVRLKAAVAAFASAEIEEEDGEATVVVLPTEVFKELKTLSDEIAATAVRGLPFEVKLAQISEQIKAALSADVPEHDLLEDLYVKKRNLINRHKSENK